MAFVMSNISLKRPLLASVGDGLAPVNLNQKVDMAIVTSDDSTRRDGLKLGYGRAQMSSNWLAAFVIELCKEEMYMGKHIRGCISINNYFDNINTNLD